MGGPTLYAPGHDRHVALVPSRPTHGCLLLIMYAPCTCRDDRSRVRRAARDVARKLVARRSQAFIRPPAQVGELLRERVEGLGRTSLGRACSLIPLIRWKQPLLFFVSHRSPCQRPSTRSPIDLIRHHGDLHERAFQRERRDGDQLQAGFVSPHTRSNSFRTASNFSSL